MHENLKGFSFIFISVILSPPLLLALMSDSNNAFMADISLPFQHSEKTTTSLALLFCSIRAPHNPALRRCNMTQQIPRPTNFTPP